MGGSAPRERLASTWIATGADRARVGVVDSCEHAKKGAKNSEKSAKMIEKSLIFDGFFDVFSGMGVFIVWCARMSRKQASQDRRCLQGYSSMPEQGNWSDAREDDFAFERMRA